ncbi:hypothetical protein SO802_009971 [Lithocarpus litseifolius]|uniref:Uncharacterized protein n=1 Tax=Lithocarpus litseifolius TaxID=425828 RepID=A0AAW2DFX4_9ROSI
MASYKHHLAPKGATHTRPLQITSKCIGVKVPMVLIDNKSTFNVCPFKTAFKIGLDMETNHPFPFDCKGI